MTDLMDSMQHFQDQMKTFRASISKMGQIIWFRNCERLGVEPLESTVPLQVLGDDPFALEN